METLHEPWSAGGTSAPSTWTVQELGCWLSGRGLPGSIVSAFQTHHVDGHRAATFTEAGLAELGIAEPLRRRRVYRELQELLGRTPASPSFPGDPGRTPRSRPQSATTTGRSTEKDAEAVRRLMASWEGTLSLRESFSSVCPSTPRCSQRSMSRSPSSCRGRRMPISAYARVATHKQDSRLGRRVVQAEVLAKAAAVLQQAEQASCPAASLPTGSEEKCWRTELACIRRCGEELLRSELRETEEQLTQTLTEKSSLQKQLVDAKELCSELLQSCESRLAAAGEERAALQRKMEAIRSQEHLFYRTLATESSASRAEATRQVSMLQEELSKERRRCTSREAQRSSQVEKTLKKFAEMKAELRNSRAQCAAVKKECRWVRHQFLELRRTLRQEGWEVAKGSARSQSVRKRGQSPGAS